MSFQFSLQCMQVETRKVHALRPATAVERRQDVPQFLDMRRSYPP